MMKHLCFLFFALFCVMGRLSAQDDGLHPYYSEGIILFRSDIDIARDGVVRVAETIRVYAAGDQIKRGIIREIPQYRTDKYGRKKRIKIHVVEVLKDSVTASYSEQEEGTNLNIRIGDPDVILGNGVYEYKIVYESRGHIGFFDGFDELYWNVTGNDWRLPIVKSSATVHLPGGAKVKQSACYTGVKGATDKDCTIEYDANGTPTFTTSTLLSPGAGFTIAVGFTAGIIQRPPPPGPWERLLEWFDIAKAYLLAVIGMLVLVPVLYRKWRKHGKDPEKKVVVARFDPPRNYSPAALRYIFSKKLDHKSFAAALVNMAVKKSIRITNEPTGFVLTRGDNGVKSLSADERELYDKLMKTRDTLLLDDTHASYVRDAKDALETSVKGKHDLKKYFLRNTRQMWTGALVTMSVLALYLLAINWKSLLLLAFITPFLAIGVTVFISGIRSFRESGCAAFFMIAFGGVFTAVPGFMFLMMATELPFIAILFVITVVTMFGFYLWLIPAPTEIGAELKAEIEGFKEYLSVAEEHRLNILTPPEHTPELFERMLPYAIALEVENEWGRKFKDLLESIDYMPDWYGGRSFAYGRIGDTFSDRFAATVQKSSAPVRSSSGSSGWSGGSSSGSSSWSSGSSGGGSSGGGGGGGGGGGW